MHPTAATSQCAALSAQNRHNDRSYCGPGTHMHVVNGGCHCGRIEFSAELSQAPDSYSPRACDCDFCQKHGATYISDPSGRLRITLASESDVRRYRQGSGAAEFLICGTCGVLVCVLYRDDQVTYGAINARAANDPTPFRQAKPVSPKTLSSVDKVKRWQEVWFANVGVSTRSV